MRINIFISDKEYYDDASLLLRSFYLGSDVVDISKLWNDNTFKNTKKETGNYYNNDKNEISDIFKGNNIYKKGEDLYLYLDDISPCKEEVELFTRGQAHDIFKRKLYERLIKWTGKELPWGFLTGVRPSKKAVAMLGFDNLFSERNKKSLSDNEILEVFKNKYMVSEKKSRLALEVAKKEISLIEEGKAREGYSLYIGLPFCPSTCSYCSFTSVPIEAARQRGLVRKYIEALKKEILATAALLKKSYNKAYKKSPTSVYFGGGTPTSLEAEELKEIIDTIKTNFDLSTCKEFTLEAGRPDSITRAKLKLIKECGVTRISINPQSMNDKTLELIGRHHTSKDIKEAFLMAREEGFNNINMDIILGLPSEGPIEVETTLREIKELKPDSLTVHSLAIKRAAKLNTNKKDYEDLTIQNEEKIVDMTRTVAGQLGMQAYYMYRQQNMAGNMENVGYAKEGKESLYNIFIMEEVQDIIALGAGASSKFLRLYNTCSNKKIERAINVKNLVDYIKRVDEMVDRKKGFILYKF